MIADYSAIIVIIGVIGVILVLCFDKMRPGFTLFSCATIFMAAGVITPTEMLSGFSNKEMITIALLFLIAEGVRASGTLDYLIRHVLPKKRGTIGSLLARILPIITAISAMINNTAIVIIFAPVIKRWAIRIGIPASKFLIPLSYATILGGMCTLVGTSTNMVVNGLMLEAGYRGFTMFELGKVGLVIAVVGIIYIVLFGGYLLPSKRGEATEHKLDDSWVEVILAPRFPGMGRTLREFDFERHYGAKIKAVYRRGIRIKQNLNSHILTEGDTLLLATDESFINTWGESSAFHIISYDEKIDAVRPTIHRRWIGIVLMAFLIGGVSIFKIDIFPLAAVVVLIMAVTKLFPTKRYTKFITWDILIAIASAFAISCAMNNSGINSTIAKWIMSATQNTGYYGALALLYLITMLFTELITNNAAVAIAFPIAMALGNQMGINPMPFFVAICIAASASFSSPIGYQTNLIVQGLGGYKFKDYLRIGVWLNLITFIISITLIPRIWPF